MKTCRFDSVMNFYMDNMNVDIKEFNIPLNTTIYVYQNHCRFYLGECENQKKLTKEYFNKRRLEVQ